MSVRALSVRCPFCLQPAETWCRAGRNNKPGFAHPARIQAAAAQPTQES